MLCKLLALRPVNFLLDDVAGGSQQIWAVDPSALPKMENNKDLGKGPMIFRPVYILQQEPVISREAGGGRGYRRYDRGRSFSPPKPHHRPYQDAAGAGPAGHEPRQYASSFPAGHSTASGSAPQYSHVSSTPRKFRYTEGFRKSFSSDQLYVSERSVHHENYFSLSSRSSSTSTGSSTRSGVWQKDMRSGIPIPISSEMKLRHRANGNNSTGPLIARRSVLGSPVQSPGVTRLSPKKDNGYREPPIPQGGQPPPPPSSGSESSGYFTPPSESHQAFVKLDTEDLLFDPADEADDTLNDKNNNQSEESFNNNLQFAVANQLQRAVSQSSGEISDINEEIIETKIDSISIRSGGGVVSEKEEGRPLRFSTSRFKEPTFSGEISPRVERKSKSVVDLQNFLPEISVNRKSTNSAPLLKDDVLSNSKLIIKNFDDTPISGSRANIVETEPPLELEIAGDVPADITITRKLSRRLSRTQSRRSTKLTPRNYQETTPKSSRAVYKPKDNLQQILVQLNSSEWEVMVQGLQSLTKIAKHNPEVVENQMHTVCLSLARHIKNLRSQVARAACHAASELFASCRKGLDMELEEIAWPLLQRTADTNKFIRADANEALNVMCEHLPLHRVIQVITSRGCIHQNSIVRSAAMRLMGDIVKRMGPEKVFQLQKDMRDKIFLTAANSLTDGNPEARTHGKTLFSCLVGHQGFQRTLLDVVPQNTLRHIAKTLATIKPIST